MSDDYKKIFEKGQQEGWIKDMESIDRFFARFEISIAKQYKALLEMEYDQAQPIRYLIAKLQKMMAICDFLDQLAITENADVDKIKIFQLISHAEIAMNTFVSPPRPNKYQLVKNYFASVEDKLTYALKLTLNSMQKLGNDERDTSAVHILYKLRNEYVHQGDFTGKVFSERSDQYLTFSFEWDMDKGKRFISVFAEMKLTYDAFLKIYFYAFKNLLEAYVQTGQSEAQRRY